jgi:cobalt transporter subunit CbtB
MTTQNPLEADLNLTLTPAHASQVTNGWSAIAVMAIGTAIVLFTLFSPMSQVHNAAHDTRHAVVAPCH